MDAITAVIPRACSSWPPMNQRARSESPCGPAGSANRLPPSVVPERQVEVVAGRAAAVEAARP